MKNFIKNSDVKVDKLQEGLSRQIMGYDSDLMVVRVYFDTGTVAPTHKHFHQQVTYVEKGKFEVRIEDNAQVLEAGDAFIIPPNKMHGATCLEEGILIDTFSPKRDDFLE